MKRVYWGGVALATIQIDTHKKFSVVEDDFYRRIQNTEQRIQNTGYWIQNTEYRTHDTEY